MAVYTTATSYKIVTDYSNGTLSWHVLVFDLQTLKGTAPLTNFVTVDAFFVKFTTHW